MINIGRFKNRLGEVNYNKLGSKMIIKEYRGCDDIDIYFPEYNHVVKCKQYSKFKNGNVKCPYESRVFKIGYIGEGKHAPSINGKDTGCYKTWHQMLRRCYDSKYHDGQPTYIDCEVYEEWLNFQNFAKWYEENYYEIEGEKMCLDKDILVKGNKLYSPNTCIFVPMRINNLFIKCGASRGNLPIRVNEYKYGYRVHCCNGNGKQIALGTFKTSHEAFLMYKINKELVIQSVAEEYKDKIPSKLYEAMVNYKIEEGD